MMLDDVAALEETSFPPLIAISFIHCLVGDRSLTAGL